MYAPLPFFGIVLLLAAVGLMWRKRSLTLNAWVGLICGIAFILWPDENLMRLDQVVHLRGFGYMLTRLLVIIGLMLHLIDVCRGLKIWDRRHALMLAPTWAAMAGFFGAWVASLSALGPNPEAWYYGGWHGHPDAVFALSIMVGVMGSACTVFGVYVYGRGVLMERQAGRMKTFVAGMILTINWCVTMILMCPLAAVEGIIEHYGPPSPILTAIVRWSMVAVFCAGAVLYVLYTAVQPLWEKKKKLDALPVEEARLDRKYDAVRQLMMILADQLVLVRMYADPAVVGAVIKACQHDGTLNVYERTVAWEAANIITLHPKNIEFMHGVGEPQLNPGDMVKDVEEFLESAERGLIVYDDVSYVVALVFGAERIGARLAGVKDWHRKLAGLIEQALREYRQPAEKLAAYKRYQEHQEWIKDGIVRDVVASMAALL